MVPMTPLLPVIGTTRTLSIPISFIYFVKAGIATASSCSGGMEGMRAVGPSEGPGPRSLVAWEIGSRIQDILDHGLRSRIAVMKGCTCIVSLWLFKREITHKSPTASATSSAADFAILSASFPLSAIRRVRR